MVDFNKYLPSGSSAPAAVASGDSSGGIDFNKYLPQNIATQHVPVIATSHPDLQPKAIETEQALIKSGATKLSDGSFKTASGSNIKLNPDGSKLVTLAEQFGGGAYHVDANNVNKIVNTGHTTYGGEPAVKGQQRDDIIPVGLGGSNQSPANIKDTPLKTALPLDKTEAQLNADVRSGKTSLGAARTQIITDKQKPAASQSLVGNFGRALVDMGKGVASAFTGSNQQNNNLAPNQNAGPAKSTFSNSIPKQIANFTGELPKAVTTVALNSFLKIGTQVNQILGGKGKINPQLIGLDPVQSYSHDVQDMVNNGVPAWQAVLSVAPNIIFDTLWATSPLKATALKIASLAETETKIPITVEDAKNIVSGRTNLVDPKTVEAFKKASAVQDASGNGKTLGQQIRDGYLDMGEKSPTILSNILKNAATRPVSEIASFGKAFGRPIEVPNIGMLPEKISVADAGKLDPKILTNYEPKLESETVHYELKPSVVAKSAAGEAITSKAAQTTPEVKIGRASAFPEAGRSAKGVQITAPAVHPDFQPADYLKVDKFISQKYPNITPTESAQAKTLILTGQGKIKVGDGNAKIVRDVYKDYYDTAKSVNIKAPVVHPNPEPKDFVNVDKFISEKYPNISNAEHNQAKTLILTGKAQSSNEGAIREIYNSYHDSVNAHANSQIKTPVDNVVDNKNSTVDNQPKQNAAPVESKPAEQSFKTGEGVSKVGRSIEVKAIEQGLTTRFENTAHYDPITIKDQAERAAQLLSDPEKAMSVIRGDAPLPEGLKGTALIIAAEEHIKATGDVKMAYELANSPLVSETSAAAQELRLAAEREPDSLTKKLQEIRKVKEAAATKKVGNLTKAKAKIRTEIKAEIQKSAPKVKDWSAFIEEIKCT